MSRSLINAVTVLRSGNRLHRCVRIARRLSGIRSKRQAVLGSIAGSPLSIRPSPISLLESLSFWTLKRECGGYRTSSSSDPQRVRKRLTVEVRVTRSINDEAAIVGIGQTEFSTDFLNPRSQFHCLPDEVMKPLGGRSIATQDVEVFL